MPIFTGIKSRFLTHYKCAIGCLFSWVGSGPGNLSHIQFAVTLERLSWVSGESLQSTPPLYPNPMSPARNKAAIVNSPNFTAACRNPVLLFFCCSTSTFCRDQSGLSRPQKPEALTSASRGTGFDTPRLFAIQMPSRRNLFPFVKQQCYPSQRKTLAPQKVSRKHPVLQPNWAWDYILICSVTKTTLNNLQHFSLVTDTCCVILFSADNEACFGECSRYHPSNLLQPITFLHIYSTLHCADSYFVFVWD